MKLFIAILCLFPIFCQAQVLEVNVSKQTGDTIYSTTLQRIGGGMDDLQVSVYRIKDTMSLEFLLLTGKKAFLIEQGNDAYITTSSGVVDTLHAKKKVATHNFIRVKKAKINSRELDSYSSISSVAVHYILTEKDMALLVKETIKGVTLVTDRSSLSYRVNEKRSTAVIKALALYK